MTNQHFANIATAFMLTYAMMYTVGGGRWTGWGKSSAWERLFCGGRSPARCR
jgi:hypothetical protein